MKKDKIDIVITDDHKLFRKGMSSLLSDFEFINIIHEAGNGTELLSLLEKTAPLPDLILLDLNMPQMDGMETNKKLKELYPHLKIIILTMEDDEHIILHMIKEGVNGYLMKNAEPEELEEAILKVKEKDYYFPDNISKLILGNFNNKRDETPIEKLTARELKTLELICKEYTATEIADEMNLSARTIEGYRSKLLDKTGTKNIAGLVVYAITNNLVDIN